MRFPPKFSPLASFVFVPRVAADCCSSNILIGQIKKKFRAYLAGNVHTRPVSESTSQWTEALTDRKIPCERRGRANFLFRFMAIFITLMNVLAYELQLVPPFRGLPDRIHLQRRAFQREQHESADNKAENNFWHIIAFAHCSFSPNRSFHERHKIIYFWITNDKLDSR